MIYPIRRTVIIGLGGTGLSTILNIKKKLYEVYGEIPPSISFLEIDTTSATDLKMSDRIIKLEANEFLQLRVSNPSVIIKTNKEVSRWFPEDIPLTSITDGAGQIRALGRLALFANSASVLKAVKSAIKRVSGYEVDKKAEGKYDIVSSDITVNIVGSLSGGTGSGTFLDIAFIVKDFLHAQEHKVIGYFLLPDVFMSKPVTYNVAPNTYAALKELDYWMDTKFLKEGFYYFGGEKITLTKPYDIIFLVNNVNSAGMHFSKIEDMIDILSLGLFVSIGAGGKTTGDIWVNLTGSMMRRWWDKKTNYSSFGVSELSYNSKLQGDIAALEFVKKIINSLFIENSGKDNNEIVEIVIDKLQIREDTADQVIDSILDPNDYMSFSIPPSIEKNMVAMIYAQSQDHIRQSLQELNKQANNNLNKFLVGKINELNKQLDSLLLKEGVSFIQAVVADLQGRIIEFNDMMKEERENFLSEKDGLKFRFDNVKVKIDKVVKSIIPWGWRDKLNEALLEYKSLIDTQVQYELEIIRREKAQEFFAGILNELDIWEKKLDSLLKEVKLLVKEVSRKLQNLQMQKKGLKPFQEYIEVDFIKDLRFDRNDFIKWLEKEKISLIDFSNYNLQQFLDKLLLYAKSTSSVKSIYSLSIEDILAKLSKSDIIRYIKKLDKMASVMWQYDKGRISGDKYTDLIYLFGVKDSDSSSINSDVIREAIPAMSTVPALISTADKDRILCFKVEASVPAFVVYNLPDYKEIYLSRNNFSYHLDKNLEKEFVDLFPSEGDSDLRIYWSLAISKPFGLIKKMGRYYFVYSRQFGNKADNYLVKLSDNRFKSYKVFINNDNFVNEVKEQIDKKLMQLDMKVFENDLMEYVNELEESYRNIDNKEVKELIQCEIDDINKFLKEVKL